MVSARIEQLATIEEYSMNRDSIDFKNSVVDFKFTIMAEIGLISYFEID